ncbi:MAG: 50S ribosomal protein L17 [Calditrichaeota bacterium]|nr:50S ribosomal protein L17 [Calditrichota bacterium]
MRHRKKGNHLGRTASHKKALMKNLAAQVIEHKEIRTTLAKAKELRHYVERLITYGKKGSLHHRRLAFRLLQDKRAVTTLFDEIAPIYEDRNGGYTRIIKLGNRKGDNAPISIFQLVGFEKVQTKADKKKKKKHAETPAPEKSKEPEVKAEEPKKKTEVKEEPAKEPAEIKPEAEAQSSEEKKEDSPEQKSADKKE